MLSGGGGLTLCLIIVKTQRTDERELTSDGFVCERKKREGESCRRKQEREQERSGRALQLAVAEY